MKSETIIKSWYSASNFYWETFKGYLWENPFFLYLIPLVPVLFVLKWLFHYKFKNKVTLAFPPNSQFFNSHNFIRHFPSIILSISLIFIMIALARPQQVNESKEQFSEGINILLALDISESMKIQDFKPNRLKASIKVASDFIKKRSQDQIGLLVFSSGALSLSPLTYDHEALNFWLNNINTEMLPGSGTAIGTAIATSVNRLNETSSESKVIILISDGENTAGIIDPLTAAKLAAAFEVRIYSVAIGRNGKVPIYNKSTRQLDYITSHLDEETLRKVAQISSGEFYRAESLKELSQIFSTIDALQKERYKTQVDTEIKDFYHFYLAWGIIFFLAWILLKSTFLSNALED